MRKVAPAVKVFVNQQTATALTAEGTVDVFYLLHHTKPVSTTNASGSSKSDDSGWSEDDTVSLVVRAANTTASTADMVDTLCYKEDEQPYEVFEYTNPPRLLAVPAQLPSADVTLLEQIDALDYLNKISKTKLAAGYEHRFYLGQVNVKLPSFGGCFHFSYVRTLTLPATAVTLYDADGTDDNSNGKVVQRRVVLAQSATVAPRGPLHGAHPDARGHAVTSLFNATTSVADGSLNTTVSTIRRRGAGAMVNAAVSTVPAFPSELTMWGEDLSHIRTLNVITALRGTGSNPLKGKNVQKSLLARTMVWVQPTPSTPHTLQLIVEADVITPAEESSHGCGDKGTRVRTVYGVLQLTDELFQRASVDLRAAYGHIDADGRLVCRLPYVLHNVTKSFSRDKKATQTAATSSYDALLPFTNLATAVSHLKVAKKNVSISAQCGFCRNEVLTSECIQALRPLPTGLLDNVRAIFIFVIFRFVEICVRSHKTTHLTNICKYMLFIFYLFELQMMHDFICCEVLPENGLTSTDLETPQHTLLYGPLYASVHPAHLAADAVQLQCKTHSTALDVFTGCGGALATAPIPLGPKSHGAVNNGGSKSGAGVSLSEELRRTKILQTFKAVINIDTCSIL